MKRIIATALIATAGFAGAASAMTEGPSANDLHSIQNYVPGADLSGLSGTEADQIVAVIQSGGSEGSKRLQIRSLLK